MNKRAPKWGQNFLTCTWPIDLMIKAGQIKTGDNVLEIGSGKGILTTSLLKTGAIVTAIEKDSELVKILKEKFISELENKKMFLIETDIRDWLKQKKLPLNTPYKVVANIPYYLTGHLLKNLLTATPQPQTIILLIQQEVAQRITETKKNNILKLAIEAYGKPKIIKKVPAGCFQPPPKVDSAILAITDINQSFFKDFSPEYFFSILKQGFGSKRQILKKQIGLTEKDLTQLDLPLMVRAEDLDLEKWKKLTLYVKNKNND
ncbi:MAG: ribosomal RNA small subunit methyltransferase A [Patescibacteria group bacterium]